MFKTNEISEHMSRHEISCKCGCGFDTIAPEIVDIFEAIRNIIDKPIIINSGCRCEQYNLKIGGRPHSYHMLGKALDLQLPKKVDYEKFYSVCDEIVGNKGAVIKYLTKRFVHIDCRGYKVRYTEVI